MHSDDGTESSFINLHSVTHYEDELTTVGALVLDNSTNREYHLLNIFSKKKDIVLKTVSGIGIKGNNRTWIEISKINDSTLHLQDQPSEWAIVCGLVFGALVMVFGIIGNTMTIAAYKRNRKLQTSFNFLITNLCAVDLVFSAMVIPLHLPYLVYRGIVINVDTCTAMGYLYYIMLSSSVINLVCIAINRYVGIVKSKKYRLLFNRERKKWWLLGIWLVTPLLYLPFILTGTIKWRETSLRCSLSINNYDGMWIKIYQIILNTSLQLVPTILLIVLYRAILKKVKRCRKSVENHPNVHTPSPVASGAANDVSVTVLKRPLSAPLESCHKCKSVNACLLQVPQTMPVQRKYEMKVAKSDLVEPTEKKFTLKTEANSSPNLVLNLSSYETPRSSNLKNKHTHCAIQKDAYLTISLENESTNNELHSTKCEFTEKPNVVPISSTAMPMFLGLGLCNSNSASKLIRSDAIDEDDVEVLDEYFVAKEICDHIEDDVFEDEETSFKKDKIGVQRLIKSLTYDKSTPQHVKPKLSNPLVPEIVQMNDDERKKKENSGKRKQSLFKKQWKRKTTARYSHKNIKLLNKNGSAITIVVDQATSDADASLMDYDNIANREIDQLEHVSEVTRESRPSTSVTDGSGLRFQCDCELQPTNRNNFWDGILEKLSIKRKQDNIQQSDPQITNKRSVIITQEATSKDDDVKIETNTGGHTDGKSNSRHTSDERSSMPYKPYIAESSESKLSSPQYLMVGNAQGSFFDASGNMNLSRRWSGQSDAISLYSGRRLSDAMRHDDRSSVSGFACGKKGSFDMKHSDRKPVRRKSIYQMWSSKKSSISSSICSNSSRRRRLAERRLAYSGIAICFAFAICVLPTSLISVLKGAFGLKISPNIKFAVALLSWVHAVINPLLYGFLNPQYRLEYKKMIKDYWNKITCKKNKSLGPSKSSALATTLRQQFR